MSTARISAMPPFFIVRQFAGGECTIYDSNTTLHENPVWTRTFAATEAVSRYATRCRKPRVATMYRGRAVQLRADHATVQQALAKKFPHRC